MLNDRRAEEIFYKDPEITRQAGEAVESFREDSMGGGSCRNLQRRLDEWGRAYKVLEMTRQVGEGVESFRVESKVRGSFRKLQR